MKIDRLVLVYLLLVAFILGVIVGEWLIRAGVLDIFETVTQIHYPLMRWQEIGMA